MFSLVASGICSYTVDIYLDFLAYTRGADEEYDKWAEVTGDPGWAWENVSQYYYKVSVSTVLSTLSDAYADCCRVLGSFRQQTTTILPGKSIQPTMDTALLKSVCPAFQARSTR